MIKFLIVLLGFSSLWAQADPIRVVIGGGPAVGKSSVILELEARGETIIRETAVDFIALQQAKNISAPWTSLSFQTNINLIQQRREENVDVRTEVIFQDRSLIDSFGYCDFRQQKVPHALVSQAKELQLESRYYPVVFFIKQLKAHAASTTRFDLDESAAIDASLRKAYLKFGYQIVDIEPDAVEVRVNQILDFLRDKNVPVGKRPPIPALPH